MCDWLVTSGVGLRSHLRLEIHLENTLPGPVVIAEDPVSCVAWCGRLSRNNDDAVGTEDALQRRANEVQSCLKAHILQLAKELGSEDGVD